MTDTELNALEAAAVAATPGPWRADSLNNVRHGSEIVIHATIAYVEPRAADAAYVATANPATILKLIAKLRQVNAERDWLAKEAATITGSESDKWLSAAKEAARAD